MNSEISLKKCRSGKIETKEQKIPHSLKQNFICVLLCLILSFLFGIFPRSAAAGDMWKAKADMPTARWGLATCVVDGIIYAFGGAGKNPNNAYATVEAYDPQTNTWTKKADMPTPKQFCSASAVNGKIYVIGGGQRQWGGGLKVVEEYDPLTDSWTTKTDMPTRRACHSASVVDGIIYVIGGLPSGDIVNVVSTVEAYDPATDTWTTKANMPTKRMWHSSCAADGKIYAIGGTYAHWLTIKRVEEYDPATDTWTKKADLPEGRAFFGASTVDGIIFAVGGTPSYETWSFSTVEAYDPKTNTWTPMAEMSIGRNSLSSCVVDGKIYAIGGNSSIHTLAEIYSTVEVYNPFPMVVDFNGDGIVDSTDIGRLVDYWQTDEPLYDIAPAPFGDGIVDIQDLIFLSEYLMKEVDDSTLAAHWALDETEGIIARDNAGENDAYIIGDPLWLPDGGIVNGALQLDGVDDCIISDYVLNPAEGPFSVFVWIKGGAPGQTVLSQMGGSNWLCTDTVEGNLMTSLKASGRLGGPLISQTNITDDNWHRIAFVWDGSFRTLYIDDIIVAQDTQDDLNGSDNGLYIGTNPTMENGTYWSGLIDDVRIYNRVVVP